jgi:hypothetical protein
MNHSAEKLLVSSIGTAVSIQPINLSSPEPPNEMAVKAAKTKRGLKEKNT